MHWFDGLRLKLRKRWDRVDAKLVESRKVAIKVTSSDGSGSAYEVREYMVDVPGRDGGEPVLVNAKRTKAMFNLADPRIDEDARLQGMIREREEKENARFEAARRKKP